MKRTTAEANDNNLYTEGNPSLGIPATVLGAEEMNNIQEELCEIVEDAGIALNGAVFTQVLSAIKSIIQRGGDQLKVAIANNQASAADVTGLSFNKTSYKAGLFVYDIYRQTSSANFSEIGIGFVTHNSFTDAWHIAVLGQNDDALAPLTITAAGQVQYTSSNMSGTGYTGFIRVTQILKLNQ